MDESKAKAMGIKIGMAGIAVGLILASCGGGTSADDERGLRPADTTTRVPTTALGTPTTSVAEIPTTTRFEECVAYVDLTTEGTIEEELATVCDFDPGVPEGARVGGYLRWDDQQHVVLWYDLEDYDRVIRYYEGVLDDWRSAEDFGDGVNTIFWQSPEKIAWSDELAEVLESGGEFTSERGDEVQVYQKDGATALSIIRFFN